MVVGFVGTAAAMPWLLLDWTTRGGPSSLKQVDAVGLRVKPNANASVAMWGRLAGTLFGPTHLTIAGFMLRNNLARAKQLADKRDESYLEECEQIRIAYARLQARFSAYRLVSVLLEKTNERLQDEIARLRESI